MYHLLLIKAFSSTENNKIIFKKRIAKMRLEKKKEN